MTKIYKKKSFRLQDKFELLSKSVTPLEVYSEGPHKQTILEQGGEAAVATNSTLVNVDSAELANPIKSDPLLDALEQCYKDESNSLACVENDQSLSVVPVQDDQMDGSELVVKAYTKGLSKLNSEQLLGIGLKSRSECKVTMCLRFDEGLFFRLAEIKQIHRIPTSAFCYEALLFYIDKFFKAFKDSSQPMDFNGALFTKSPILKQKIGWVPPKLRSERISYAMDSDTDYILAKICKRTRQYKVNMIYDAVIYYMNHYYKDIRGF